MTDAWKPAGAIQYALLGVALFSLAGVVLRLADVSLFANWWMSGALTIVYAAPLAFGLTRLQAMGPIVAVAAALSICVAHAAAIYFGMKIVSDVFGGGDDEFVTYVRVGAAGGFIGALTSFIALAILLPALRKTAAIFRLLIGVVLLSVLGAVGLGALYQINLIIEAAYDGFYLVLLQALAIAILHHVSWQTVFSWLIVSAVAPARRA